MANAREIHGLEEQARERGEFLEALKLASEAMLAYQEAGDDLGFTEVLQSVTLILRHLNEKTGYRGYLHLAAHYSVAGVDIAEEKGDKSALVIPYHTAGKTYETLDNYEQAVVWHTKAVEIVDLLPERHNREGYKAEVTGHLYSAKLMTGDRGAYDLLLAQMKRLEESDEPKFNKDVWMSGMHMSAADGLLNLGEKDEARKHMDEAKKIVDANPELVLRRQQWEKKMEKFA